MRPIPILTLSLALAAASVITTSCAGPKIVEWESTGGWLFSENKDAIEAITGQTPDPVETFAGPRYFVPGSMRGRFTYDPENVDPIVEHRAHSTSHAGTLTDWWSQLDSSGSTIGTFTGDAGRVIVSLGNESAGALNDLIDFNMCGSCLGANGFTINGWRATTSSVVWNGEEFHDDLDRPLMLPPENAPTPLGIFDFYNQTLNANASIMAYGLDFREVDANAYLTRRHRASHSTTR